MVTINTERKAVEIRWDSNGNSDELVTLRATGAAGDVHSTREFPNDGLFPVSYPFDFKGTSLIEVLNSNGEVIDTGEIKV